MHNPDSLKKLSAAKAAMPNPVKDTDAFKYKYATLAQVNAIVDGPLRDNGLECVQWVEGTVLNTAVVDLDTGEEVLRDFRAAMEAGDERAKGSSQTYQSRYAKLLLFGLAPEDDDGEAASRPQRQQPQQQPQPDPLTEYKARLWAAVCAYADKTGGDAKALAEGCKKRHDYAETAEWYDLVASEFESELQA